jgi:REP element-mobilizing transposase RayT
MPFIGYAKAIPARYPLGPRCDAPWAYFLTFSCYGNRLHGDNRGSVDRNNNGVGAPFLSPRPLRRAFELKEMGRKPARLDAADRRAVREAIQQVCGYRNWTLYALHVRATHVHVVVAAEVKPEHVMTKFKTYASRKLNQQSGRTDKHWGRHGSTLWLWSSSQVDSAIDYVLNQQGKPLERYELADRWSAQF